MDAFSGWIISWETCKSFCKSGHCVSVWELVDGSFLSKIALIDRQFWLASFCFSLHFCNGILRGANIKQKNKIFDVELILSKLSKQTLN